MRREKEERNGTEGGVGKGREKEVRKAEGRVGKKELKGKK